MADHNVNKAGVIQADIYKNHTAYITRQPATSAKRLQHPVNPGVFTSTLRAERLHDSRHTACGHPRWGTLHIRNNDLHALVVSLQLRHLKADLVVDELQAVAVLLRAVAPAILERGVACMWRWVKTQPWMPAAELDSNLHKHPGLLSAAPGSRSLYVSSQSTAGAQNVSGLTCELGFLVFAVPCNPTASGV